MNTRIDYSYKNATGLVLNESIVIDGELQLADIILFLQNDTEFIPSQVDLPALNGKDVEVDGPFHKMINLELTDDQPTIKVTANELTKSFRTAHQEGWNEMLFFEEVAMHAAAEANGFFLREPKKLSHLTNFKVRVQSEKFGLEDFKHFDLEHALQKIVELYHEALKLNDGIERTIGLVMYPAEQGTVVTVYRSASSQQSLKVLPDDLSWACDQLGTEEPQPIRNSVSECAFSDSINYDLLKSFLKQKELLV